VTVIDQSCIELKQRRQKMRFVLWLPRLIWCSLTAYFGDAAWVFVGAFVAAPIGILATCLLMLLIDHRPSAWSEENVTFVIAVLLGVAGLTSIFFVPTLAKQHKGKKKSKYTTFDPDFDQMF